MSLLRKLRDPACWEAFYSYKSGLTTPKQLQKELRAFIDREAYVPVCDRIDAGAPFALPKKAVISKIATQKKRTVYTYPPDENMVLKLLTWLLLRTYDGIFSNNLYSFRPERTAKTAVLQLMAEPGIKTMYAYKADVSNYFNSIPTELLLPRLKRVTADDPELYRFLASLLTEPEVWENGRRVTEQKGIMAGTPVSAFYANLFLAELDRDFAARHVPYARYSDDIIVFAETPETLGAHEARIKEVLRENGLKLNPDKEERFSPEQGWVFLGFRCRGGTVDVAPASVKKLKQKMRRKARALQRWQKRNELEPKKAAVAFVRVFNRKLFENPVDNELTWAYWYFPVLTTDESLHELDRYAQDCLRFLMTGKRTKARFNARYADLKALGYKSLVHEYYEFRRNGLIAGS